MGGGGKEEGAGAGAQSVRPVSSPYSLAQWPQLAWFRNLSYVI